MKNYYSLRKKIYPESETKSKIYSQRSKFSSKNHEPNNFNEIKEYLNDQKVIKNGKLANNIINHNKKKIKLKKYVI